MAQLVVGTIGAVGGFILSGGNPLGAQLGWALGATLGARLGPQAHSEGPRLADLRVTGTEYGQPIPWIAGAPRIAGQLWWASTLREIANTESAGKGGGPTVTSYTYEIDAMFGLADQEIGGVTRVWWNGKLVWTNLENADEQSRIDSAVTGYWSRITVYTGAADQLPDPTYEADVGASLAPGYRGRGYVFIQGMQLGNSGQMPNLTFEVASALDNGATIVRRYAVASTGVDLIAPAIVAMRPNVRCAVVSTTDVMVYEFDIEGNYLGTSARSGASETFPGPAGSPSDYPVGIIDGEPVRWQNVTLATGDPTHRLLPVGTLNNTGSEIAAGADLTYVIPAGLYLGQVAMCSDGLHCLIMCAPSATYSGSAVIDRWYLVRRSAGTTTLVDNGTIETPVTINKFGFGNAATYHFGVCMLEDDLLHLWWAYGAGTGDVAMYRLDDDGVMRLKGSLASGAGMLSYSFTKPSIWAEAGYCVAISRTSFVAFSRSGDVINTVTLRSTVEALCGRAGMSAAQFDASGLATITKPVRALAASQVGPTRSVIEQLQAAYYFEACLSDKLYFRPRASAAVATIPFEDLAAGIDGADAQPLALTIASDLENPAQVAIQYRNMADNQQTGTEYSDRIIAGQASLETIALPLGFNPAEAKGIADAIVSDRAASLVTTSIALPPAYARLEASDVVTVIDEDGTTAYRLRLTRRTDEGLLKFDAVIDDAAVVTSAEVTDNTYSPSTEVRAVADSVMLALDIPILRDADDAPGYYVAARGASSNWPGGVVQSSADNVDFATVATMGESAVIGTCTTTLGDWAGGLVIDEINSVTVNVAHGELTSTTRDTLLADQTVNAMLIGDEVIRFITATLTDSTPNFYKLTRLIRGCRGTEWAQTGHAAGERAVLLRTRGLRRVTQQASEEDQLRYLKAVTSGKAAADVSSSEFTNTGISAKCFAPVDVRVLINDDDQQVLSWVRRTRLATSFVGTGGSFVPLGETSERYEIDILNPSSAVVSTIETTDTQQTISGWISSVLLDSTARIHSAAGDGTSVFGLLLSTIALTSQSLRRFSVSTGAFTGGTALTAGGTGYGTALVVLGAYVYVATTNGAGASYVQKLPKTSIISGGTLTPDYTYTAPLAGDAQGLAYDGSALWVSCSYSGKIERIRATDLVVVASVTLNAGIGALCYSSTHECLFIADRANDRIIQYEVFGSPVGVVKYIACVRFPVDVLVLGSTLFVAGASGFALYDVATGVQILALASGDNMVSRRHLFLTSSRVALHASGTVYLFNGAGAQVGSFPLLSGESLAGTSGNDLLVDDGTQTRIVTEVTLTSGYSANVYQINSNGDRGYPATVDF